ncbi:MAG: hypothetical protein M1817_002920 [Caeruleum heppii]|nr:MAG: hypothetical protein M1817_002920 [Caeruleum heppii]
MYRSSILNLAAVALLSFASINASPLALLQSNNPAALLKRGRPVPNYLACVDDLPQQSQFPQGYLRSDYPDLQSLCALGSAQKNLGCECRSPGDRAVCHALWADFGLWQSVRLKHYCQTKCACLEESKGPVDATNGVPPIQSDAGTDAESDTVSSAGSFEGIFPFDEDASDSETSWNSGYTTTEAPTFRGGRNGVDTRRPVQPPSVEQSIDVADLPGGSCNVKCSNDNIMCGEKTLNGLPCRCFALSASVGAYFFSGLCANKMPWIKRDMDGLMPVGCACNTTYVSQRCCDDDVSNGLVWEAPELKLGELKFD